MDVEKARRSDVSMTWLGSLEQIFVPEFGHGTGPVPSYMASEIGLNSEVLHLALSLNCQKWISGLKKKDGRDWRA